jgi:hypothetical protein
MENGAPLNELRCAVTIKRSLAREVPLAMVGVRVTELTVLVLYHPTSMQSVIVEPGSRELRFMSALPDAQLP